MHLVRMWDVGFSEVVENVMKEDKWFLGVWNNEESFEDAFICLSFQLHITLCVHLS